MMLINFQVKSVMQDIQSLCTYNLNFCSKKFAFMQSSSTQRETQQFDVWCHYKGLFPSVGNEKCSNFFKKYNTNRCIG